MKAKNFKRPVFVGLGVVSRSGKDTFANFAIKYARSMGYTAMTRSFASAMKLSASSVFDCYGLQPPSYYEENVLQKDLPLTNGITPRRIWEDFGEAMRKLDPNIWVNNVRIPDGVDIVIFTDVRHKNELDWLKNLGAFNYYVERMIKATHKVDKYLTYKDFDSSINNVSSLETLESIAKDRVVEWITAGKTQS